MAITDKPVSSSSMAATYCSYAGLPVIAMMGVAQSVRPRAPVAFALQHPAASFRALTGAPTCVDGTSRWLWPLQQQRSDLCRACCAEAAPARRCVRLGTLSCCSSRAGYGRAEVGWVGQVGGGECPRSALWSGRSVRTARANQPPDQKSGGLFVGCAALGKEAGTAASSGGTERGWGGVTAVAGDLNRSAFVAAGGVDGHEPTERPTRASRAVLRWSARHGKRGPVEGNAVREEPGMSRRGVRQQPKHKAARPDIYRRRTQHEIWAAAPRRRRVGVCQTPQEGQRGGHLRCQRGPSVRRRVVCAGQLGGGAPQDVQIRRLTQHLGQRDPGRRVWGARLHAIPCLAPHLRFRLRACALAPATQEHGAAGGTSRQRDHTEV